MVHFVMYDREDVQWPSNGQRSICVIIIAVGLLHVHVLEIVKLMCRIGFRPNGMCIPKALQRLAFRAPSKFVASSFCDVFAKVCFLDRTQFGQRNWLQTNLLANIIYIQQYICSFRSRGKNLFNNLFIHWECTCFMRHRIGKRDNDGR